MLCNVNNKAVGYAVAKGLWVEKALLIFFSFTNSKPHTANHHSTFLKTLFVCMLCKTALIHEVIARCLKPHMHFETKTKGFTVTLYNKAPFANIG